LSEIVEASNISDVHNTQIAIRKIQLKILKILDKCPLETRMVFGDGDVSTITITFLEHEHERDRKTHWRGPWVTRKEEETKTTTADAPTTIATT
jgi:hypothetical protein